MLVRTIYIIILFFVLISNSYSAASSSSNTKSNYDNAANLIKAAKRYETKGKDKKAKKDMKKH